jgi:hypothetical protein
VGNKEDRMHGKPSRVIHPKTCGLSVADHVCIPPPSIMTGSGISG